jgi:hypothetical protein
MSGKYKVILGILVVFAIIGYLLAFGQTGVLSIVGRALLVIAGLLGFFLLGNYLNKK